MNASVPFQPLAGVRILAWEQAVALPMATRLLADLGATVIRMESHTRAPSRGRHLGNDLARNKLGLAVDLRQAEGQRLVKQFVREVDVVCENFTPRVKQQFGLTYEALQAERPDLIMLSLTGYGQTGAWSERPTYGPGIEAASGHAQSMGYADAPPTRPGTIVFGDNISGFYAALSLIGSLHRRRATGKGEYIDLSMYEANAFHLGSSLLSSSLSGRPAERRGNTDAHAHIQGVYASRDPERWLAVTVRKQDAPALPEGIVNEEQLESWIGTRTVDQAANELRQAGIAAAPVLNARDVLQNEQLRHRGAFSMVQHEVAVNTYAAHPHAASPFLFANRPRPPLREAPAVGQDSRTILATWLHLPDAEIDALIAHGIIGVPAATPAAPITRPLDPLLDKKLAWRLIAGYDDDPGAVLGLDYGETTWPAGR